MVRGGRDGYPQALIRLSAIVKKPFLGTTLVHRIRDLFHAATRRRRFCVMDLKNRLGGKFARSLISVILVLISVGLALPQDKRALESRGEALVTTNCLRCHAVGRTGNSTHPQAPPFRTLGQRYPIEVLAEALAEGLSSGHPDMPEFRFEVDDVDAILAYLESIQEKGERASPTK
jgi:cytochrome c